MKENNNLLPENLHSILIGLMLGDAGIYKSSKTSNSRLEMSFGTKYKQFAEYIENLFKGYINNPIKQVEIKVENKIYINYRLKTKTCSADLYLIFIIICFIFLILIQINS
jgi:hypothetical protein